MVWVFCFFFSSKLSPGPSLFCYCACTNPRRMTAAYTTRIVDTMTQTTYEPLQMSTARRSPTLLSQLRVRKPREGMRSDSSASYSGAF